MGDMQFADPKLNICGQNHIKSTKIKTDNKIAPPLKIKPGPSRESLKFVAVTKNIHFTMAFRGRSMADKRTVTRGQHIIAASAPLGRALLTSRHVPPPFTMTLQHGTVKQVSAPPHQPSPSPAPPGDS